jgi:hypothetical protein
LANGGLNYGVKSAFPSQNHKIVQVDGFILRAEKLNELPKRAEKF